MPYTVFSVTGSFVSGEMRDGTWLKTAHKIECKVKIEKIIVT